ncbi:hypothetical protein WJM93_15505 [Lactiplantibacillus plantarum]|uniref:hypothetical protein n=1 Tax=Lactiplantibacillus plantarum TaxID=1590 RepID=UPI0030B2102E
MSYEKTTWKHDDIITAEKLNHIEEGIAEVDSKPSVPGPEGKQGPQGPAGKDGKDLTEELAALTSRVTALENKSKENA